MERTAVASSSIKSVGYDPLAQVLEVEHSRGDVWRYQNVTSDKHAALMAAASIGQHFNQNIKDRHPGKKL